MLNVFIGYDSNRPVAHDICKKSIIENTNADIEFHKIGNSLLSDDIYFKKIDVKDSTEFSTSRFLVPFLMDYQGIAIFMDDDFVWKSDIYELLNFYQEQNAVTVVKHKYEPKNSKKMNNIWQSKYHRKNWSSLMIFNAEHQDCKKLDINYVNNVKGLKLHQFDWTENIGEIPKTYNFLVGDYEKQDDIKAYHFTNGLPELEQNYSQDYKEIWLRYYNEE